MIEILDKQRAKLIVNIGSGKNRKRRTKTVTYTGKRDLDRQYKEFEEECKSKPRNTGATVRELVESYIKNAEAMGAKATTLQGYESTAKRIYSAFEGISADSLQSYQVADFVLDMTNKGLSAKSIKNTMSILRAAYNRAIALDMLDVNPCSKVKLPKNKTPEKVIFDNTQYSTFMDALNDERLDYKVAYLLAMLCGLRRSEILGLKESDIIIPFRQMTIKETRHRIKGKEDIIQDTKTDSSYRTMAIPEFLLEDIIKLIEEHHANPYNDTDYLIQNGFGQPMSPSTLTKYISKVNKKHNLPHVTTHGLRHTYASILNYNHVDIARISKELGHSNISTTLNIYTHVFNNLSESSKDIANTIDNMFSEDSATILPPEAKEKA